MDIKILKIKYSFGKILAGILALFNIIPSLTVIFNPLLFIMFLPLGVYAVLTWPWTILKDIPDPFHPGESLYWLTYIINIQDDLLFPSLFRWGILDSLLLIVGSTIFLSSFIAWLANLRRKELIMRGIYGIIRHPQYLGIIVLTLGISVRSLRPISLIAWLTLTFGYLILASLEEKHLLKTYKEKYEEYSKRTPFIVPFLKLRLPYSLSPERFYRYVLLATLYVILTLMAIVGMRSLVVSLRATF